MKKVARKFLTSKPWSLCLPVALLAAACGGGDSRDEVDVRYDEFSQRLHVSTSRDLGSGETLHAQIRKGEAAELDCAALASSIERVDSAPVNGQPRTYAGPPMSDAMFESPYDTSWVELREPTPEMLASIAGGKTMIDVCWMKDGKVVNQSVFDARRALDRRGRSGKFDDAEARVASTVAYAELCVGELGEIPFFEKKAEGDYGTYNCLDSVAIPTTVTDTAGNTTLPENRNITECDKPQYIYSLCEPNAVDGRVNGPRVTSAANDQGTHWVLLCRKAQVDQGQYDDIAMIGHNPFSGKTCYFQNALYSLTDGLNVPHPGDKVDSTESPQISETLWDGIHGGLGSRIECAKCHDADAFIHTPWIDGAKDENGDPVVPKMGINDDFVLGYNDAPYSIINTQGQGWTMPKHLTSPEAAACTRCHRIGDGEWTNDWIDRLVSEDTEWNRIVTASHRQFDKAFWMPPEVEGLDESTWDDSDFGKAVKFIQGCATDPASCQWAELPTEPVSEGGGLPTIELEGDALASAALKVLGADVVDPTCPAGDCRTRRCAECHSVSAGALDRWLDATERAWNTCNMEVDPDTMSEEEARAAVNCLRVDPSDSRSVFTPENLGVLSTGVQYGHFRKLFRKAYGDSWLAQYARFKSRVSMPKGSHPKLSQREYATVQKWFKAGLANMANVLREIPAPTSCTESFDRPGLDAHMSTMRFEGWAATNRDNGIRMFGCAKPDAITCFDSGYADRSADWGAPAGTIRELTKLTFNTSYWTRSSADGRYIGNGGGNSGGSTITDLATGRDIKIDASYDPGFFPDNSGFVFQGGGGGMGVCAQSILETDADIDFTEAQCIRARGVALYQHVARGINGGDYFVINSQFVSDPGGASRNPSAHFDANSTMKFTPMGFNGVQYEPMDQVIVDSPFEGDSVLSPSGRLVASRLAGDSGRSLGYVIRRVDAARTGSDYRFGIDTKLATVCLEGAKVNFSFDERFVATHVYDADGANIVLVDLVTGQRHQVTDMPPGSQALFPHFRSDGWLYFLVKTADGSEYVAASDLAVRLAN